MFRLRDSLKPRPDRSSRLMNDDFRGTADGKRIVTKAIQIYTRLFGTRLIGTTPTGDL